MKNIIRQWKALLLVSALGVLAACFHSEPYTIHFVNYRGRTDVDKGFEQALKDKHVKYKIVYHNAERNPEKFPSIIAAIRADKETDLVVTWGTTVTLAVIGKYTETDNEKRIKDLFSVFTLVTDPFSSEIVSRGKSLPRNITGAWHVAPLDSQFGAMMVYRPGKKIGILYTPTENNAVISKNQMIELGKTYGVEVIAIPFDLVNGKPVSTNAVAALQEFKARGAEWVYLLSDTYLGTQAQSLVIPEAHKLGLITFASTEQLMLAGAAFGLIAPYTEIGAVAAEQAYQILEKKVLPGDVRVTPVNRFQHQMNSKVLRQLLLNISSDVIHDIKDIKDITIK